MAYIVDTTTRNLGNYKSGGTIDYGTANKQAQERAKQRAATNTSSGSTTSSGNYTSVTQDDNDGGSSGGGFNLAAYLAQLQAEARARAQAAYDRNMARIASAYDSASGNLKGNYDSTVSRLNSARDKSYGDVNSDAEDSLREAYINNMLSKKNLNQRLSAMGYNGGATESTMASLANQYGNSRTDINNTLNDNIANLEMTYGDNLASALQAYNSAMSNLDLQRMQLEMQAENALQSAESGLDSNVMGLLSSNSGYLSALESAVANQGGYSYTGTEATNTYNPGNAVQASSTDSGNNYAKALAQAQLMASQGQSSSSIQNFLAQASGGNVQTLAQMLQALGY